jgi:hypothetical protein
VRCHAVIEATGPECYGAPSQRQVCSQLGRVDWLPGDEMDEQTVLHMIETTITIKCHEGIPWEPYFVSELVGEVPRLPQMGDPRTSWRMLQVTDPECCDADDQNWEHPEESDTNA